MRPGEFVIRPYSVSEFSFFIFIFIPFFWWNRKKAVSLQLAWGEDSVLTVVASGFATVVYKFFRL